MQAAELLEGRTLQGERAAWTVRKKANFGDDHTGGHFSVGYEVEATDGSKGFLKALDYSKAFEDPDPARVLNAYTNAFIFERNILDKCSSARLSRVIRLLDHGTIKIPKSDSPSVTQYLIFEFAESDARRQASFTRQLGIAWALRCLHHVSVGLRQLHTLGITHQDLKPSNVLIFDNLESKIGDLGRSVASEIEVEQPHEHNEVAGDWNYAPPELHYRYISSDWRTRRVGCDIYQMGGLLHFFFAGTDFTTKLASHIDPAYHWNNWSGKYADVLPYVREAFEKSVEEFKKSAPDEIAQTLSQLLLWTCEPDPNLRGVPSMADRLGRMAMQQFESKFDLLARRAETGMLKEFRK